MDGITKKVELQFQVGELGEWVDDTLIWYFRWKRYLYVHEKPVVAKIISIIWGDTFSLDIDKWIWKFYRDDSFSMSCANYSFLEYIIIKISHPSYVICVSPLFVVVWDLLRWLFSLCSFSLIVFPREKIYSRERWLLILVLPCAISLVISLSRFLTCDFVNSVWSMIFSWLGWQIVLLMDPSLISRVSLI